MFMNFMDFLKIIWNFFFSCHEKSRGGKCWHGFIVVVQLSSHVQLSVTPQTAAGQASLSLTISRSLPKFMSIALLMPSSHLILWCPLLRLPSIFPSIRDFSNESSLEMRTSEFSIPSCIKKRVNIVSTLWGWFEQMHIKPVVQHVAIENVSQ